MKIQSTEFVNGILAFKSRSIEFKNGYAEVPEHLVPEILISGNYIVAPKNPKPWKEAKSILFARGAGLGDVLMCTPLARKMRKIVGRKIRIDFITAPEFKPILIGNPHISNVYSTKDIPLANLKNYNCNLDFNNMEFRREHLSKSIHRVDVFADLIPEFPRPLKNKRLVYRPSKNELDKARDRIKKVSKGRPLVCMPITANCPNRILQPDKLRNIASELVKDGNTIILIDKWKNKGWNGNGIVNWCGRLKLREACAVVALSDIILTPDTGILHIAAALDKVVVAYFGAIDWKLRKTHDKLFVVYHDVPCYPCNAYNCRTAECVRKLSVSTIVNTVRKALGK